MPPIPARILAPAPSKFIVGQRVTFTPGPQNPRAAPAARFTVVRVLPGDGGQRAYRIKAEAESYERVAEENQLAAHTPDGD